jgi:hypothetical protein
MLGFAGSLDVVFDGIPIRWDFMVDATLSFSSSVIDSQDWIII